MGNAIHCPKCGCEFELSTLVRAQLEGEVRVDLQADFDRRLSAAETTTAARMREKDAELEAARLRVLDASEKEAGLLKRGRELDTREREVALDVERRVADATGAIRQQEAKAAQERYGREAAEQVAQKDRELQETRGKLAALAGKEAELLKKGRELADREQELALDVERRVADQTKGIREQEAKAAQERFAREADQRVSAKDAELAEARAKLAGFAATEAELLRKARELEERQRELDLDVERRLAVETKRARENEAKLAEKRLELERDQQRLKDEEHRQQTDGLQKTITELQRKVQQGSQQTQGEAQEVVLRDVLERSFPADSVDDVPKGMNGADLLHRVRSSEGRDCGLIVWESKRTRAWSDDWLPKLRDDQRAAGAACAVIVSQVLPSGVRHFALVDGVWVCAWEYAAALGTALRLGLVDVATARQAAEGRGEKMQMLFDYLTGTEFKLRVEGFVEAFRDMQEDLESEKRAMLTRWNYRSRLMQRARDNITAFCGDLRGIAGGQLLDLPALALEPLAALPAHAEGDSEDGAAHPGDAELKEILFGLLPADGTTAGNGSLTDKFIERALLERGVHASADDYARCKAALLAEGRARRGKGKGGSVCRAAPGALA